MSDTFEFKGKTYYRGHVENGPFGSARRISTKPWPEICPTCGHTSHSATTPQGELVERAAKRICLATGLDWDSIDDVGPDDHSNNSGDETKGWFRYLARAALPNTTGEAE